MEWKDEVEIMLPALARLAAAPCLLSRRSARDRRRTRSSMDRPRRWWGLIASSCHVTCSERVR